MRNAKLSVAEPALCPGCGSLLYEHEWVPASRITALALDPATAFAVRVCPACQRDRSGVPHGYVHLVGDFLATHRAEIETLLHGEVGRAREDNPLHHVLGWEDDGTGGLLIATSTENLAQRLGHAVNKAYDGEVHYRFSPENTFAHVWWRR